MKFKSILAIIAALIFGALIGWKATIYTAQVDCDGATGYITAWGQTDAYYMGDEYFLD